ncbi:MAG TPA: hypothetical protein VFA78_05850 [Chloroflexota bacterium]|nr:hypothetical protein [Chloroflexota bacterium]
MNRTITIAAAIAFSSVLAAQTPTGSSIRIGANVPWAQFMVDGQTYTGMATFLWPQGSKHTVQFISNVIVPPACAPIASAIQAAPDATMALTFSGWTDNAGLLTPGSDPVQTITADPRITSLLASVSLEYRVILNFFQSPPAADGSAQYCQAINPGSPGGPASTIAPGIVYVGGNAYVNSAILYLPAGPINVNAMPYPGFVFLGWNVNSSQQPAYLNTLNINGPITLVPQFETGKRVRFLTNPPGLHVLVDRAVVPTAAFLDSQGNCPSQYTLPPAPAPGIAPLCTGDVEFIPGSTHVLSAPTPQTDTSGNGWVFDSWDRGGGQNTTYVADNNTGTMDVITANFKRGGTVSFVVTPQGAGLTLSVDGRQNWPSLNFVWEVGSTHDVIAPAQQTDVKGRKYAFQSWSNNGPGEQTITVDQNTVANGMHLSVSYNLLSRLIVQTTPPGLNIQVDGSACVSPCTIDRPNGTQVHVTVPASVPVNDTSRYDFASWSDGGASDHVVTMTGDTTTLSASYNTMYSLNATSNVAGSVNFAFNPASPDMFYPANTQVSIKANVNPGYKFRTWSGDLNGSYPAGSVSIARPCGVVAMVDRIPYVAPTGVQNAAGQTPDPVVAPGSLISIFGASLSNDTVVGPTNPLAQTLDGVALTVGDQVLPLTFVSPNQINAQVPSNLADGDYVLTISTQGQTPLTTTFTVARNAPGLFTRTLDSGTVIALANHADGTPVTADSPAQQGETITIFGTGFGPLKSSTVDGFLVQGAAPNPLVDTVGVQFGSSNPVPVFAGAAAGSIGMDVITLQITPDLPSGTLAPLTVTVNGRSSNTVQVPLQ